MNRDEDAIWLLGMLEALAAKLEIALRLESLDDKEGELQLRSGACRLKGKDIIFIDRRLPKIKQCDVIIDALKHRDLSNIYVPPALRRLIDG